MKSISRLTDDERAAYERDGYLVRHDVFDSAEVAAITDACEALVADLVRDRQGSRLKLGSYVFDPDFLKGVTIKWEGDSGAVHGIEPFAHLSKELHDCAYDPRFVEPMIDMIDTEQPELFTEKLNLKRPFVGGPNPLHQDFPYWKDVADDAEKVATAILFLDDATIENGCLQVVPGSHRQGVWSTWTEGDPFFRFEIDQDVYADVEAVPVEVGAGAVVSFGPYLAHKSAPNHSERDRRALLFSYQPAGSSHMLDQLRRMGTPKR